MRRGRRASTRGSIEGDLRMGDFKVGGTINSALFLAAALLLPNATHADAAAAFVSSKS